MRWSGCWLAGWLAGGWLATSEGSVPQLQRQRQLTLARLPPLGRPPINDGLPADLQAGWLAGCFAFVIDDYLWWELVDSCCDRPIINEWPNANSAGVWLVPKVLPKLPAPPPAHACMHFSAARLSGTASRNKIFNSLPTNFNKPLHTQQLPIRFPIGIGIRNK